MNNDEKFQLITENLQEVIRPQVIHDVLAEGRPLKIYWGMFLLRPLVKPLVFQSPVF